MNLDNERKISITKEETDNQITWTFENLRYRVQINYYKRWNEYSVTLRTHSGHEVGWQKFKRKGNIIRFLKDFGFDINISDLENKVNENMKLKENRKTFKYFAVSDYDSDKYYTKEQLKKDLHTFGDDIEVKVYTLANVEDVTELTNEDLLFIWKNGKIIKSYMKPKKTPKKESMKLKEDRNNSKIIYTLGDFTLREYEDKDEEDGKNYEISYKNNKVESDYCNTPNKLRLAKSHIKKWNSNLDKFKKEFGIKESLSLKESPKYKDLIKLNDTTWKYKDKVIIGYNEYGKYYFVSEPDDLNWMYSSESLKDLLIGIDNELKDKVDENMTLENKYEDEVIESYNILDEDIKETEYNVVIDNIEWAANNADLPSSIQHDFFLSPYDNLEDEIYSFLLEYSNGVAPLGYSIDYNQEDYYIRDDDYIGDEDNAYHTESLDDEYWLPEENPLDDRYDYVDSKNVYDSDGFITEYTMYYDTLDNKYVFVFGDSDLYKPEDGDFDWECETKDEAEQWFRSYNGFEDELDESKSTKNNCKFTFEAFYQKDAPKGSEDSTIEQSKKIAKNNNFKFNIKEEITDGPNEGAYVCEFIGPKDKLIDVISKESDLDKEDIEEMISCLDECKLKEDTIKQNGKWVNKGKEGTHGTFKTKKQADAQRKAMFANGYKGESLEEAIDENKYIGKKAIFTGFDEYEGEDDEARNYEGKTCTITCLGCEVDDDFESNYWDIKFEDGFSMDAVSGYCLDLIENESLKEARDCESEYNITPADKKKIIQWWKDLDNYYKKTGSKSYVSGIDEIDKTDDIDGWLDTMWDALLDLVDEKKDSNEALELLRRGKALFNKYSRYSYFNYGVKESKELNNDKKKITEELVKTYKGYKIKSVKAWTKPGLGEYEISYDIFNPNKEYIAGRIKSIEDCIKEIDADILKNKNNKNESLKKEYPTRVKRKS